MTLPTDVFKPLSAALGSGRIEDVLACLDPDGTVVVQLGKGTTVLTGAELRAEVEGFLSAFESLSLTAVSRSLSGSSITEEAVFSGSHVGQWAGIQPTHHRVHINVRLVAEQGGTAAIRGLWVEPDTHALMAQIGQDDDILGMAGGLVAAVRERAVRPVWVTGDSPDEAPAGTAASRPKAQAKRPMFLAVASLLVLAVVAAVGLWMTLPLVSSSADSRLPATAVARPAAPKAPAVRKPVKAVPARQPVIATASTKIAPRVQAGQQVVLSSDVLFGLASSKVTPGARSALLKVAQQVRAAKVTGTIQVNGYTDKTGNAKKNLALSRTRALAVARVLQPALSGLKIVLAPQGFGETSPLASNSASAGQTRNRRVTIVLPKR